MGGDYGGAFKALGLRRGFTESVVGVVFRTYDGRRGTLARSPT